MKRLIYLLLFVAVLFTFMSCGTNGNDTDNEREEFLMTYEKKLKMFDSILSSNLLEDERYKDMPWVTDRIQLPDSETMVSLDLLKRALYVYEMQTGNNLQLTAEEIVDLYNSPNEGKQAEFEKLCLWYANENGADISSVYTSFLSVAYQIYKDTNGKAFMDKELRSLNADESYALAQWAFENIDYELTEKAAHDPEADYVTQRYILYLRGLGLIDADGKAKAQ